MAITAAEEERFLEAIKERYEDAWNYKERVCGKDHAFWDELERWENNTENDRRGWANNYIRPNLIRQTIDLMVAALVGDDPVPFYIPQEADDAYGANVFTRLHQSDWRRCAAGDELTVAAREACRLGTGLLTPYYDSEVRAIELKHLPSRMVAWSPQADRKLQNPDFVVQISQVPLDKLVRLFPAAFKAKKGRTPTFSVQEKMLESRAVFELGQEMPILRLRNPPGMGAAVPYEGALVDYDDPVRAQAVWMRFWLSELGSVERYLPSDMKKQAREWKNRSVLVQVAGNRLLSVTPNRFEGGRIPIVKISGIPRPESSWDRGDIEDLIPLQKGTNILYSRQVTMAQRFANRPWIADENALGINEDEVKWEQDRVIKVRGGPNNFQLANYDPPSPAVQRVIDDLRRMFAAVSGQDEVSQGIVRPNLSGAAISKIQGPFFARMEPRRKAFDRSINYEGELYVDLAKMWYKKPDAVKRLGEFLAEGWDELRKEFSGSFDSIVETSPMIRLDPKSMLDLGTQLDDRGFFDPNTPVEKVLGLARLVRYYWPGADKMIAEIEARKKNEYKQRVEARAQGATVPGQPPPPGAVPGEAPLPDEAPVQPEYAGVH